jgi:iron complex outermembrane recepter protein
MMRARFPFVWAMLVWLALPPSASSQATGSIRGRVIADTGRPLPAAQVVLAGTTRGTLTNEQGQYVLVNVPAGAYTVEVRQIGYAIARGSVRVVEASGTVQDFTLAPEAVALEQVVVSVGSRAAHTAANELAVPVDVFPASEIAATGRTEMAEVLTELSPAIYFPRQQISDITSGVRPFQLRGLSPDHSLVLVNGKRRHPSAVVHVFGGAALTSGSSGVDMNAIPGLALGQMEILRDGAAAQYGSDAIAGVINMGLKNTISAPTFTATLGQYFPSDAAYSRDGLRMDLAGNVGLSLFGRGTLNVTGQVSDRQPTHRACPDPRDQIVAGDRDVVENCRVVQKNNVVEQPNHLWGDGEFRNYLFFWNAEVPLSAVPEEREFYLFGGFSQRQDKHSGFYRRGLDNRNWPQIHPQGFLPSFRSDTRDLMAATGVRGTMTGWSYDLSGQYGHNRVDNDIFNSHNVSLGPCLDVPCAPGRGGILGTADDPGIPNKTEFYAGSLELNQLVADFDITRRFEIGLAAPLNVALGATARGDNYRVVAGEPGSYVNGYHPNRSGGTSAVGSQVFAGFTPAQAADAWRNNVGVYADLETDLHPMLRVATAARFENYSDFGSTLTGKLAARFQPVEQFIVRGAVSTGFRAPALSQSYYGHTSTGFRSDPDNPGNQIAYEIGEFPINSPEARALGATDLKEERSINFSGGVAITPTRNFNVTTDLYFVRVDDRIMLTNSLDVTDDTAEGRRIRELLAGSGAESVKYFTNAFSTETRGVDFTANYRLLFGESRFLETMVSYNWNENKLVGDIQTPPVLAGMGSLLFPADVRTAIEKGRPRDRLNGRVRYNQDGFGAQVGANYFGKVTSLLEENPDVLEEYAARTIVDAEANLRLPRGLELTVGAENLLDTYPQEETPGYDFNGIFRYPGSSPFGYNGRFLFTRVRVAF